MPANLERTDPRLAGLIEAGIGALEGGGHAGTSGSGWVPRRAAFVSRRSPVVASTSGASHGARDEAYFFSAG